MLSVFPDLLFLSPFAALLIRAALGLLFLSAAWRHVLNPEMTTRIFGFAEGAIAVGLIMGAWTQPAAIVTIIMVGAWFMAPKLRPFPKSTLFLALIMALTLLLTGPGPFAFDLPL